MGRAALPWAVVALLLVLTPAVHGDLGLFSSSSSSGAGGSSKPAASTEEKGSKDGEHHPQIIVTGAEVGVDEPPEPASAASSPGPTEPTEPTLLGDLISAASGESNGTIAQVLDKALAKEFAQESKNAEEGKGKTYNETVHSEGGEAKTETVVRISAGKRSDEHTSDSTSDPAANTTSTSAAQAAGTPSTAKNTSSSSSSSSTGSGSSGSSSSSHQEKEPPVSERGVDRIIDSQDNEFVLSAPPKDQVATLTLDPLLIQDLTFLFASAAVMGMVFESLKQPVINGYLVAGAIVGPGGLQLIKELVQVESLAQLGVQLLLFHLGRELSFSKLKAVWSVALVGGALQIVALSALGGVVAAMMESPVTQGIFVGALLSMSSTSVVVKCLDALRMNGTAFGQIVIGTLILQDCSVGIMFALMPAFGTAAAAVNQGAGAAGTASSGIGAAAWLDIAMLVCMVLVKLLLLVAASFAVARLVLPTALQLLLRYASGELVQLSLVSLCLCSAWLCGRLGLSEELGAFMAGAMMALAEQRLVASGHMVPSSAPHSPGGGSKGHLSEPDSPTSIIPAVLPKSAAPKHNSAAVAYYRHATQRQVQRGPPEQQSSRGSYHDTESGDVIAAVHDLDSMSLTTQLQDLQQQHQALLAGQQPSNGGIGPVANTIVPSGSPRAGSEVHGPSVMANIESIQNVLTALFVASMGLIMSPVFLWHHASVLLTGALVVMLLKAAVVTLVVRMFDVPLKLSLAVGLSMAHIGEFSFVLLSMANQLKLLSSQVYMLLLGVTAMSLLTTPVVIMGSIRFLAMAKEGHHQIYITGPRLRLSCDRE